MTLSFVLALVAGILAVVAGFSPEPWRPRAVAAAVVLLAIAVMLLSGGVALR
jgi:NO-binding membrane sensor protein with MHYT domain